MLKFIKYRVLCICSIFIMNYAGCGPGGDISYSKNIFGHDVAQLSVFQSIPASAINNAKLNLHIAYGHTSHGSQLIDGMNGLKYFAAGYSTLYDFNSGGYGGALDLTDGSIGANASYANDLGNPDRTTWADATRAYIAAHLNVNVVIWSWCGQVSSASEADITNYLSLMDALESDYPNIKFVYMTGHLDGSGLTGNLHLRNNQIREFCQTNGRYLFDFEDIESYDPDGNYYGDKNATDACNYTFNNATYNWAQDWQNSHTQGVDWYNCSSAHSEALNANMKAYAAWRMWAVLGGWDGN
jgi:hypothetical protein